jgi:uncharacterized protein
MKTKQLGLAKMAISMAIFFILYHCAEYMVVFKNSAAGFFLFQFLFFISAWLLGHWNKKNGFACWGLSFSSLTIKHVLLGISLGIILYAVPYFIGLALGTEFISDIPSWQDMLQASIPFTFGVIFSSFSEDILTRGTVFSLLNGKVKTLWLILISAILYLLNHIYRLHDGFETVAYLFLLGVLLAIPLVITKNLWLTGFMHWSGNAFFFITHNVVQTEADSDFLTPNQIFLLWILILIPITWFAIKKLNSTLFENNE